MRLISKLFVVCFVWFTFLNLSLQGQDTSEANKVDANEEDLGFEIEEDDGADVPETTFLSYWDEHFILGLGSSFAIYNSGLSSYSFLGLSYEEKVSFIKFKFAGDLQYKYREVTFVKKDDESIEKEVISKTDFKRNFFTLRDLYFQFDILGIMQLSIGRKLIVWGQFDMISPVDFVLPISFNTSSIVINKVANRLPQDVVQLNIYPTGFLEFQLYWFPNYTVDEGLLEVLGGDLDYPKGLFRPSLDDWYGEFNAGQYAARTIGYFGSFTLALTYIYTWDSLGYAPSHDIIRNNPDYDPHADIDGDNQPYNITMNKKKPARSQNFGIEMGLQTGQWIWKAEAMYTRLEADFSRSSLFIKEVPQVSKDHTPESLFKYADWLISKNSGEIYGTVNRIIAAIGTTGELDRWKFDLAVLTVQTIKSDLMEEGEELAKQYLNDVEVSSSGDSFNPPVVPSFNIVWYSVPSKKGALGLAGGLLSIGGGALLYYVHEIAELVTLGVGIEGLSYIGTSEQTIDFDFAPKHSFNLGGRFVFSFKL